jgi:hypothetical protein
MKKISGLLLYCPASYLKLINVFPSCKNMLLCIQVVKYCTELTSPDAGSGIPRYSYLLRFKGIVSRDRVSTETIGV